ncbi:MAG: alpha/beta hydrolase [Planctomycetota bacterium]|jgi:esterase/lipase superfamily enzyme
MTRFLPLLLAAACTATGVEELEFMTAPAAMSKGVVDPFDESGVAQSPTFGILYATDREPEPDDDADVPFYRHERGKRIRFGEAFIELVDPDKEGTWDENKQVSFSEERDDPYEMTLSHVDEFGVYDESVPMLLGEKGDPEAGRRFAAAIDGHLARTPANDVYVYVHGYKADFAFPVLVSAQLWYFVGLRGAFIAYSWPATPNPLAYFKDIETAGQTARNLRVVLQFIAKRTKVRRIHVLGYSAGTRVVSGAIGQLALIPGDHKIGQVVLVGADVDRDLLTGYVQDGALDVVDGWTIYQSSDDSPLGLAAWLFKRPRAGQFVAEEDVSPQQVAALRRLDKLALVSVQEAKGAAKGNGHGYFRKSPWVSSDILLTFMYGRLPAERGLVRRDDEPFWHFPDDYVERLKKLYGKGKMKTDE